MIRNYLGFPRGISGAELATRAFEQAVLFGTEMVYGGDVVGLAPTTTYASSSWPTARHSWHEQSSSPAASPTARSTSRHSTRCKASASTTARRCPKHTRSRANTPTSLAAATRPDKPRCTWPIRRVRDDRRAINTLAASMSDYLVKSVERTPNIEIRYASEVVDGGGDGRLEWLDLEDRTTGTAERIEAAGLFVLIGAEPCTDWLPPSVAVTPGVTSRPAATATAISTPRGDVRRSCSRRPCPASSRSAMSARGQ